MDSSITKLWTELDGMIRWAEKVGIAEILLEDELVSDFHSHPHRSDIHGATKAVRRGFACIRAAADPSKTEEDLDQR